MSKYTEEEIIQSVPQKGFFGHPKGLMTLFLTEFWERFSYYGMRAILIYYMYRSVKDGGLGMDENLAISIMAIYGSLVYMSGIIGGWLADRLLGKQRAIFYGGVMIMFGHIVLALPFGQTALFASMFLIIIGTGMLKPNASSVVGDMYSEQDNRRDSGFSLFYMGINLGAFIAPLIVGTVSDAYNFHVGFALAAVGMFFGLLYYWVTHRKTLGLAGREPENPLSKDEKKSYAKYFSIFGVAIVGTAVISAWMGWLTVERFIMFVSFLGLFIPTVYFIVMYRSPKTDKVEQSRLLAYIPLFLTSVVFWAIYQQSATVLAQYADKRTNLEFLGITLQPAWFQSVPALFVITLSPLFAILWLKWGDKQPSIARKFAYGLMFAGFSFLVMIIPALTAGPGVLVHPGWLVLSFFLAVVGELLLSPVGLSATTKLAPKAFSAQTMSLWFLSIAAAEALNAQLVRFYSEDTEALYFGGLGGLAVVLALVLLLFSGKVEKLMKGVK